MRLGHRQQIEQKYPIYIKKLECNESLIVIVKESTENSQAAKWLCHRSAEGKMYESLSGRILGINQVCWPLAVLIISLSNMYLSLKKITGTPVGSTVSVPQDSPLGLHPNNATVRATTVCWYVDSQSNQHFLLVWLVLFVRLDTLSTNNVLILYDKAKIEIKSATPMRTLTTWSTFTNKYIFMFSYTYVSIYIYIYIYGLKIVALSHFVGACVYSHITISNYYRLK